MPKIFKIMHPSIYNDVKNPLDENIVEEFNFISKTDIALHRKSETTCI